MPKSLRSKTIIAGGWLFLRKFIAKIIGIFAVAILARKLSPADFGLVALARVVLSLVSGGISQGTATYVIYDNKVGFKKRVNTAFWLNVIFILIVFLLVLISLPLILNFYKGTEELKRIILVFLIVFILNELRAIPDALIKKQLLYNKIVLRDTIFDIIAALLSVYMAIAGYGIWSLVTPALFSAICVLPISFFQARWFPGFPGFYDTKPILKYTLNIIGSNVLTLLVNRGDNLIIGKMLGFTNLGLYNRAFATANLAVSNIKSVVTEVTFPSLSQISNDINRLKRSFLDILTVLSLVGLPISIFLIVLAKETILVLYGPKWLPSIIPLQILSIMALRRIVGSPAGSLFNSVGKPQIMLKFATGFTPIYLLSILIGSFYGIQGVAIAVTIIRTLGGIIIFYLVAKELSMSLLALFKPLYKPFLFSVLSGGIVLLFKNIIKLHNVYINLTIYSTVGMVTYFALILSDRKMRIHIVKLLKALKQ